MLWIQLQNSEFGVKFRKQFPIDAFMCSFASTSPKICIEIDETIVNSDRDEYLKQKGYKVLRF